MTHDESTPQSGTGNVAEERPATVAVVVVTHGCVCGDLVAAAESIVGPIGVESVSTAPGEPSPEIQQRVAATVQRVDAGRGVLLLTDLHGSTPANACTALLGHSRVAVLFGVNLPMLIKLSTCDRRSLDPQQLGELLQETGRRSIRLAAAAPASAP